MRRVPWRPGAPGAALYIEGNRALGYGLKYPSGFQDTHLQRL